MKRGGYAAVLVVVFTVVVIAVLIVSFAFNGQTPKVATSTPLPPTATPLPTGTLDPCSAKSMQSTVSDFDKLSREFNDAFVLAQNTPAAQLSPVITDMQRIRREAQDYAAPVCLVNLKQVQLGFMNAAIDACLSLYSAFGGNQASSMSQDQVKQVLTAVNERMSAARQYSAQYTQEMARLLGVTLTPSPTFVPLVTPGPGTTPTP